MQWSAHNNNASIWALLKPYMALVWGLLLLTLAGNAINLIVPKIISGGIDTFGTAAFNLSTLSLEFLGVSAMIFVLVYLQNVLQVYISEKVAKDLRARLIAKISTRSYAYIQEITPSKLLTNLTSDIDSVKSFVSQAISSLASSVFLIIGSSILLLMINWQLALAVIAIVPIIGVSFGFILGKVRKLFKATQETIDWLNKIINESILGASLIRILNSQALEYNKFLEASTQAKEISFGILKLFATLIPIVTFVSNLAILTILVLGGHFVITGSMTLGDFSAFNGYLAILIFPIFVIGFMSGVIAQATASYARIAEVLYAPDTPRTGTLTTALTGKIEVRDINLHFGEKIALRDISFTIQPHTKTAIIGPTAAGKTQLLSLLMGLIQPTSWTITYDGHPIDEYNQESLYKQISLVFQDSNLFNLSIRENIAFSKVSNDAAFQKAIKAAELEDFVKTLPDGLETVVSERGVSLSGGQKQRIMLARALTLDPKILFLDDFTARLDTQTEQKILQNIHTLYPETTLISVTQKIESIQAYDQIILLMEGEILAIGTHDELMATSPEYVQIYNSQFSTNNYELSAK